MKQEYEHPTYETLKVKQIIARQTKEKMQRLALRPSFSPIPYGEAFFFDRLINLNMKTF